MLNNNEIEVFRYLYNSVVIPLLRYFGVHEAMKNLAISPTPNFSKRFASFSNKLVRRNNSFIQGEENIGKSVAFVDRYVIRIAASCMYIISISKERKKVGI